MPTSPNSVPVYCTRHRTPRVFSFAFILKNTESGSSSAASTSTTRHCCSGRQTRRCPESFLDPRLLRLQREVESALQPTCWCASCAVFTVFRFSVCSARRKTHENEPIKSEGSQTCESSRRAHLICCASCRWQGTPARRRATPGPPGPARGWRWAGCPGR